MTYGKHNALKKGLALLLALATLFSCGAAALAAANAPVPVIYVLGRSNLYITVNGKQQLLQYSTNETITNVVKEAIPYAVTAYLTNNYDAYSRKTYALLMDAFEGFPLNEDGEVDNGSGVLFKWNEAELEKDVSKSDLRTYSFSYDSRLSPLEVADELYEYIEAVKRATGSKKVSLAGRCLGANMMLAYLYKYQEAVNFRGIDSVVFYDSSVNGVDVLDAAMSGTVTFENDALASFLNNYDPKVNSETLAAMLALALQMMQGRTGIKMTSAFAQKFYSSVRDTLMHDFMKSTYATAPGFWSMVNEHYDEAKDYIFNETRDAYTYARLIRKIDSYRKNVQLRAGEIIKNMRAAGVHVAAVCKYGFQSYPLCEDSFRLSDNTTSLVKQSFGATCSKIDSTLDQSYVESRKKIGYGAYISPDGQLDASTALLRDTTWYIKNLVHADFPACVDNMILSICRRKTDVYRDAQWPQFMMYLNKAIVPMTEENCDPRGQIGGTKDGSLKGMLALFQAMIKFFRTMLERFLR